MRSTHRFPPPRIRTD